MLIATPAFALDLAFTLGLASFCSCSLGSAMFSALAATLSRTCWNLHLSPASRAFLKKNLHGGLCQKSQLRFVHAPSNQLKHTGLSVSPLGEVPFGIRSVRSLLGDLVFPLPLPFDSRSLFLSGLGDLIDWVAPIPMRLSCPQGECKGMRHL